jgi:hypothetical protein
MAIAFKIGEEEAVLYNDSTEAVKEYNSSPGKRFRIEFVSRDDPYQSVADRLSKKFSQSRIATYGLCKLPVESFKPDILKDIAINKKPFVYIEKNNVSSTKTKTCYRLIIRDIEKILHDEMEYVARSGEIKNIKVATDISRDMGDPEIIAALKKKGIILDGSYFLLTDETWGLRVKGDEAYSILPSGIMHRIICHEVERTPGNLIERASAYLK